MCAIESGNLNVVVHCLNSQMQPFLKDALDRDALDYARHFSNVQGHDMTELINRARESWQQSYSQEEFEDLMNEQ